MRTRHTLTFIILASALFLIAAQTMVQAQDYTPTPVSVSKDRVRGADGKVYWSHAVVKNQTIYSIAKAYMVSVNDIYAANPKLKEQGLKADSIILVPISEKLLDSLREQEAAAKPSSPGEGTGTAVQQDGDSPTSQALAAVVPEGIVEGGEDYFIHVVKWYENLDDIAKKYGIPSDYLLKYNGLESKKQIKSRMRLKIPRLAPTDSGTTTQQATVPAVDSTAVGDNTRTVTPDEEHTQVPLPVYERKTKAKIALLMPLGSHGSNPNVNNMDFYAGVLMAVRDAGRDGFGVDLSVFDIQTSKFPVDSAALSGMDFVIGPTGVDGLRKVLSLSGKDCAVISPLDPKAATLTQGHANFIQAPSSASDQLEDLVKWIGEQYRTGDKIIVISESGTNSLADLDTLFKARGLSPQAFSFSITEGRTIIDPLCNMMVDEGMNHVIIRSEKESFTFEAVRNLNLALHRKKPITLYSPSRIRNFSTIDVENLHELNLHTSMSYFVDYYDQRVKTFLPTYRSLFGAEPSQFSFQGYDLTLFFLDAIRKNGNLWLRRLADGSEKDMLQSNFLLTRTGENGGFRNEGIRRAVYTADFKVVKEK